MIGRRVAHYKAIAGLALSSILFSVPFHITHIHTNNDLPIFLCHTYLHTYTHTYTQLKMMLLDHLDRTRVKVVREFGEEYNASKSLVERCR